MAYEISIEDCRKMSRLMKRIEEKKFNENDREELTTLTARFLFFTRAVGYTDGYTLKK